jgi:hypothetical protein
MAVRAERTTTPHHHHNTCLAAGIVKGILGREHVARGHVEIKLLEGRAFAGSVRKETKKPTNWSMLHVVAQKKQTAARGGTS